MVSSVILSSFDLDVCASADGRPHHRQPLHLLSCTTCCSRLYVHLLYCPPVDTYKITVATAGRVVGDAELTNGVADWLKQTMGACHGSCLGLVETAGGVASPTPSGALQVGQRTSNHQIPICVVYMPVSATDTSLRRIASALALDRQSCGIFWESSVSRGAVTALVSHWFWNCMLILHLGIPHCLSSAIIDDTGTVKLCKMLKQYSSRR